MTATCFALVSALVLAQAGGEKKDQPPVPAPTAMAKVIFVHASPDAAPTVDVYVNGEKKVPGLAYGKPSKMTDLAAGDAKVEFKVADKALGTAATLKLVGNKQYTIAATGKAAEVKYQLIEAKATAGKAHVIFFHASPDAGSLDVKADGKDWTKGLAMGKSFDAAMDAGKHKFDLMVGSAEPALTKELDLKADVCYCVFATGTKTTPKLELVVAEHAMPVKKPT